MQIYIYANITIKGTALEKQATSANGIFSKEGVGSGKKIDPYLIKTAADLKELAEIINGTMDMAKPAKYRINNDGNDYFELTANIDLRAYDSWKAIKNFEGYFEGNNHTISNLRINQFDLMHEGRGLFGTLGGNVNNPDSTGGHIRNVQVVNCDIASGGNASPVGGIAGMVLKGSIENCSVTGTIRNASDVGGIVGSIGEKAVVKGCTNEANISQSSETAGGIAGQSVGTIIDCYNTGIVQTDSTSNFGVAGGIVGRNSGSVENCYNTGKVIGGSRAGGIIGTGSGGTQIGIKNCYNTGDISAKGEMAGGIAGETSIIENCYNTGTVTALNKAGGIVGEFIYLLDWSEDGKEIVTKGNITNCVSLGKEVNSIGLYAENTGRIYGSITVNLENNLTGIASNNYAWNGIKVINNNVESKELEEGFDKKDGCPLSYNEKLLKPGNEEFDWLNDVKISPTPTLPTWITGSSGGSVGCIDINSKVFNSAATDNTLKITLTNGTFKEAPITKEDFTFTGSNKSAIEAGVFTRTSDTVVTISEIAFGVAKDNKVTVKGQSQVRQATSCSVIPSRYVSDELKFDIATPSSPMPVHVAGEKMEVKIDNAKNAGGALLDGQYRVTITSDEPADGKQPLVVSDFIFERSFVIFEKGSATVEIPQDMVIKSGENRTLTVSIIMDELVTNTIKINKVSPGVAKTLEFSQTPLIGIRNGSNEVAFSKNPALLVKDNYGNLREDDNSTTVSIKSDKENEIAIGGTTTVSAKSGVVTFTDLTLKPILNADVKGMKFIYLLSTGDKYNPENIYDFKSVQDKPVITTELYNIYTPYGKDCTITIEVKDDTNCTYQWMVGNAIIQGAVNKSYTIPKGTPTNSDPHYSCVVTNSAGSVTSGTFEVVITVISPRVEGSTTYKVLNASPNSILSVKELDGVKVYGYDDKELTGTWVGQAPSRYGVTEAVKFRFDTNDRNYANGFIMISVTTIVDPAFSMGGGGVYVPPTTGSGSKDLVTVGENNTAISTIYSEGTLNQNGKMSVDVTEDKIKEAVNAAKEQKKKQENEVNNVNVDTVVEIKVNSDDFDYAGVTLPNSAFKSLIDGDIDKFKINTPTLTLTFDAVTIRSIFSQSMGDITIAFREPEELTKQIRDIVGKRPIVDISIQSNKGYVTNFGKGDTIISIPYAADDISFMDALIAYHFKDDGTKEIIKDAMYDEETKQMNIKTSHFSIYGIGYKEPIKFSDVDEQARKNGIDFVVSRGIMSSEGKNKFVPKKIVTRSMFAEILGKMYGVNVLEYKKSVLKDINSKKSYAPYANWAIKNKIMQPKELGKFAPDTPVTREEIAVALENFVKYRKYVITELPVNKEQETFDDIANLSTNSKNAIRSVQMAGIMDRYSSGKFNPKGKVTKAQMAVIVKRFYEVTTVPSE